MPIISAQYHRIEMFAKSRIITTWFHCVLVLSVIHMCLCLSQLHGLPEPVFTVYAFVPKVDVVVEGSGTSINENICRVFQRPLAYMHDQRASKFAHKQIISPRICLGATD